MLCQRCGKEIYDNSTCPECGAARKLPMSGCLAPETLYEIRNIVPQTGEKLSPTGRVRPRGIAREIDINVPVLRTPGGSKKADGVGMSAPTRYLATGVIVLSVAVCLAAMAFRFIGSEPANEQLLTPRTAAVEMES